MINRPVNIDSYIEYTPYCRTCIVGKTYDTVKYGQPGRRDAETLTHQSPPLQYIFFEKKLQGTIFLIS